MASTSGAGRYFLTSSKRVCGLRGAIVAAAGTGSGLRVYNSVTLYRMPVLAEEAQREQRHDPGGGDKVVYGDIFVGLMGQNEPARAVGNALLNPGAADDVLLIVSAGANDEARLQV